MRVFFYRHTTTKAQMSKESQGLVPTITTAGERFSSAGASFSVHEWRGSGPATLHVHHADDEAWHVLHGVLLE